MNPLPLPVGSYAEQLQQWPQYGQRILAHYDNDSDFVAEQRDNISS